MARQNQQAWENQVDNKLYQKKDKVDQMKKSEQRLNRERQEREKLMLMEKHRLQQEINKLRAGKLK